MFSHSPSLQLRLFTAMGLLLACFKPNRHWLMARRLTQNTLCVKQAIIVLREELEYFSIPPTTAGGPSIHNNGLDDEKLLDVKCKPGEHPMNTNSPAAPQRNVNEENNIAE
jgi:hypothetical protein